jgi:hypothetical protein
MASSNYNLKTSLIKLKISYEDECIFMEHEIPSYAHMVVLQMAFTHWVKLEQYFMPKS